jgi:hypothetical protein
MSRTPSHFLERVRRKSRVAPSPNRGRPRRSRRPLSHANNSASRGSEQHGNSAKWAVICTSSASSAGWCPPKRPSRWSERDREARLPTRQSKPQSTQ